MTLTQKFLERLKKAYHIVVFTGAGMSAPSGVPTFRGKDGLWNRYNPQDLANRQAFLENPDLVWKWYSWRRQLVQEVQPNLGHYALVDMESYFPAFQIITQNVDNLHQRAGSRAVIELHGNLLASKCIDCTYHSTGADLSRLGTVAGTEVPACPQCGALIRPDVVWFGEALPVEAVSRAQECAAEAEIFLSAGTSSTVEPAASLPYLAKGNGAFLVEINPEETPLSGIADLRITESVDKSLPLISMQVEKLRSRVPGR